MAVLDAPDLQAVPATGRRPPRQHAVLRLVIRRLLMMIPTLFGIVTITFLLTHVLGGNPARQIAGQAAAPATIAKISAEYGFNKPLIVQYGDYLSDLVHGNLGVSIVTNQPVLHDLATRLPATLELVVLSIGLALLIGLPLGAYAARTRRRWVQSIVRGYTFVALAVPDFWLGLIAIYLLYFKLGWLPATGQVNSQGTVANSVTGAALIDSLLSGNGPAIANAASHLIMPVGVLALLLTAPITRLMRSATITVMESDFMRFGTSVGLGKAWLWRYSVRAALPTVITFTGTLFSLMIGGAVLIETVFSWGGAAQYAATAIERNDFNATQGFVLTCGVITMVVFLLVDLIQLRLDPRIRAEVSGGSWRSLLSGRPLRSAGLAEGSAVAIGDAGLVDNTATVDPGPDALPGELPDAPAKSRRSFLAPWREFGAVLKELVLDARPQAWPSAAWQTIRGGNAALLTGGGIIVVMVLAAFIVPVFWTYGATTPNPLDTLAGPSLSHPFGTDNSGFDVFIRVLVAARTDLWIAALGIALSVALGTAVGLVVGFSRGKVLDAVVMRICDMIQAFPVLIVAIALVAFAGNDLINVVWALLFINAPIFLRLARGQVLTVREHRYVEAAHALGNSRARIMARHILPNITGQAVVQVGIQLGYALLTVAGLAFLGVGVQAPTPEWGSMILTGTESITTGQWWTVVFPGLAILVAVAGFNLFAEGVEKQRDIYR
jgi:ABC-type dipeptide/oligopeptide/nickel transport system permease component